MPMNVPPVPTMATNASKATTRLLPQFRSRPQLMGARVRRVAELVGAPGAQLVDELRGSLFDQRQILAADLARRSSGRLRHQLDLRAVGREQLPPLGAVSLAHHGDHAVAHDRAGRRRDRCPCCRWSARRRPCRGGDGHPARASRRHCRAARSLMLPPGFIDSSLSRTRPGSPSVSRSSQTAGVPPIASTIESRGRRSDRHVDPSLPRHRRVDIVDRSSRGPLAILARVCLRSPSSAPGPPTAFR